MCKIFTTGVYQEFLNSQHWATGCGLRCTQSQLLISGASVMVAPSLFRPNRNYSCPFRGKVIQQGLKFLKKTQSTKIREGEVRQPAQVRGHTNYNESLWYWPRKLKLNVLLANLCVFWLLNLSRVDQKRPQSNSDYRQEHSQSGSWVLNLVDSSKIQLPKRGAFRCKYKYSNLN